MKNKTTLLIISLLIIAGIAGWFIYRDLKGNNNLSMPDLNKEIVIQIEMTEETAKQKMEQLENAREALDKEPDNLTNWLQWGILLKSIGDYEGAIEAWEYASFIRPQNSISFHNLGDIFHYYLKDFEKAEIYYSKAIENNPSQFFTYNNFHELYRYSWAEKADLADDVLLQGIEANPADPYLIIILAQYYLDETKEIDKAIIYYEKALELDPNNEALKKELQEVKG